MLGASCFSGVASVTMEYMLKGDFEFWSLNLLLATYSIIPASIPIISDCIARGDFQPYRFFNISVWVTIVISALGGILVSMVMKYADNVLKGYSISAALIGTVFINGHFSQAPFSWLRIFGALVIVCSMLLYAQSPKVQNETSPKDEAV
jgi:UDP-sugar transporter A1/2/3